LYDRAGGQHNAYAIPWVESVEGEGIGQWIQVELFEPKRRFYILNGFVDPYKPSLYKMNSRVKEAQLIGVAVDKTVIVRDIAFEDFVYFKTVVFDRPVVSMKLVIKSVYKGSRWQDTAISSILLSSYE